MNRRRRALESAASTSGATSGRRAERHDSSGANHGHGDRVSSRHGRRRLRIADKSVTHVDDRRLDDPDRTSELDVLVGGRAIRAGAELVAEKLRYRYPSGPDVLEDLSLALPRRELVCVYAQPEAGKTTLARLLNGELVPASGSIRIDSRAVDDEVARVGFPPSDRWPENYTSRSILYENYRIAGLPEFGARRVADETLRAARLEYLAERRRDAMRHVERAKDRNPRRTDRPAQLAGARRHRCQDDTCRHQRVPELRTRGG